MPYWLLKPHWLPNIATLTNCKLVAKSLDLQASNECSRHHNVYETKQELLTLR